MLAVSLYLKGIVQPKMTTLSSCQLILVFATQVIFEKCVWVYVVNAVFVKVVLDPIDFHCMHKTVTKTYKIKSYRFQFEFYLFNRDSKIL